MAKGTRKAAPETKAAPKPAPVVEEPTEITLTLHSAACDPLPLYVHGVGRFALKVGEERTLPAAAVDGLRNSDATFTIKDT